MPVCKMARFTVKKERLDVCLKAIEEFTAAVKANEPRTRLYAAFQEDGDATSFVHVMIFEDEAAEALHRETEWVKRFVDVLYQETTDGVAFTDYRLVAAT